MVKRGYFFTLDAFVAMGIIMVGLILMMASYSYTPSTTQSSILSNDLLLTLSTTKITEINNDFVRNLTLNGTITNEDNSLMQQIGEFYANNQKSMGFNFIANISNNLVPQQYGINISVNKEPMYWRGTLTPSSKIVVASKSVVFGIYNNSMWGPFPAEVRIWQ